VTLWTTRAAGQPVSKTQDGGVVLDPSLSPNWLQLPAELGGAQLRVAGSCWLPVGPNPAADPRVPSTWWLDQRTRWHVLEDVPLVVAEVEGRGWVVLDPGPQRRAMLRDACGLPQEREAADA
jgi:hypothetical protein